MHVHAEDAASLTTGVSYNRDVRPILAEHCFACHGPDDEHRKADLRLDSQDDVTRAGVIKPGDAGASELVKRLKSQDPDEMMPPPESGVLSQAEKDVLSEWINLGAEYQKHWAFEPVVKSALPRVSDQSGA